MLTLYGHNIDVVGNFFYTEQEMAPAKVVVHNHLSKDYRKFAHAGGYLEEPTTTLYRVDLESIESLKKYSRLRGEADMSELYSGEVFREADRAILRRTSLGCRDAIRKHKIVKRKVGIGEIHVKRVGDVLREIHYDGP